MSLLADPAVTTNAILSPGDDRFAPIIASDRRRRWSTLVRAVILALVIMVALASVGMFNLRRLADGVPSLGRLLAEMMPPDFTNWQSWLMPVLSTVAMSIAGTFLAVICSFVLGFLSARTTSPHPIVFWFARTVLNVLRAIPELIMGIVFVAAVGFGALPGVLALGFHSIGAIGKFFSESIEHADPAPVEAVRATGASPLQVILHGVLPQVLPQMMDAVFYRWEYNFRASTVMGMVGAGGIGFELIGSLRIMQYQEVSAILLVILAMVTLVDGLGGWLRRRFS